MDSYTKQETGKSRLAGIVGGFFGYLIGYLSHSTLVSFALFFVLGYFFYDIRHVGVETKKAWLAFKKGLRTLWSEIIKEIFQESRKLYKDMNPHPYLTLPILFYVPLVIFALGNSGHDLAKALTNPFGYVYANCYWLLTSYNITTQQLDELGSYWLLRLSVFCVVAFFSIGAGVVFAFMGGRVVEGIKDGWTALRKSIPDFKALLFLTYKLAVSLVWFAIFMVVLFPVLIMKAVLGILVGIHTFRRLATGLAVLAAGAFYLVFVPFNIGLPVALTAIGCGLSCGGVAHITAWALDGEAMKKRLMVLLTKPITSFVPVRISQA